MLKIRETQLRSRLKKWGVTKPSRQRRKKLPQAPTVNTLNRPGMFNGQPLPRTNLMSLRSPAFPDQVGWNNARPWPVHQGSNQLPLMKDPAYAHGHANATEWPSVPIVSPNAPGVSQPQYLLHQLSSPLSPANPYAHSEPIPCTIGGDALQSSFTDPGFPHANEPKDFAGEFHAQPNSAESNVHQTTPQSMSWDCSPETCPPRRSSVYTVGGSTPTAPGYAHYPNSTFSDDSGPTYSESQSSSSSDVDIFEQDSALNSWARSGSFSLGQESRMGKCRPSDKSNDPRNNLTRLQTQFDTGDHLPLSCLSSAFPDNGSFKDPTSPMNSAGTEYSMPKTLGDPIILKGC